ncbi:hypothetical protein PHJA_000803800 [Phtheirospermum japonicum]|uniref:Uncharacterized protein n=1 Tax=Phtheirospermum japonicum TaxID=374723 RepID=A0A830BG91_9LAMI|nr:hypothetical protein PHJA_000803800 [Phtheirospermum japonicum]
MCEFTTKHGHGQYGVYTAGVARFCHQYCFWKVRRNGPCLQVRDQLGNELYECQDWKHTI